MPLPTPNPGEQRQAFISRCAGSEAMNREFPDSKQRVAVCYSQWRGQHGPMRRRRRTAPPGGR